MIEPRLSAFEHQPEKTPPGTDCYSSWLEGCADAGYIRSFCAGSADARLRRTSRESAHLRRHGRALRDDVPFRAYRRYAIRSCRNSRSFGLPSFLVGFSLGGNVALKLAGELGETNLLYRRLRDFHSDRSRGLRAQCLDKRSNMLYARRFLTDCEAGQAEEKLLPICTALRAWMK